MKFDWRNFTEENFVDYCARMENNMFDDCDFVANVRIGDICFDLMARLNPEMDDDEFILTYDAYVGGVDTGYGNGKDNYPYDECGGGDFEDSCISMTYEDFQKYAEKELENFITESNYDKADLVEKANEELHIW